jgi:hypothetical protein
MPTLDIFNDDAFSLSSLTKSINDAPHQPGRIGQLGLFSEEGINTTSLMIEKQGTTLNLVSAGQRGAPAAPVQGDKRQMLSIMPVHLPQRATINADEVQNVRAFGAETEVETVQNIVNKRLNKLRRNLDATIEYQRMGAIKGQVLDADGSTVLLDLFNTFGVSQQTKSLVLGTPTTKVRTKVVEAKRLMEVELGNLMYSDIRVLCSAAFFDAFIDHAAVVAAYDRYQNGEFFRNDQRGGFYFGGVFWEEYRGKVGSIDFIADGDAYMIPSGVSDLFVTNYAPADYMETVNTNGLPYYAKQEVMRMDKGIEIESQSNPISICTRPRSVIKLTA